MPDAMTCQAVVPCVRNATKRMRFGKRLFLCEYCARLFRYRPNDFLDGRKTKIVLGAKRREDNVRRTAARNGDVVITVSGEFHERLVAFAAIADATPERVLEHYIVKALNKASTP